MKVQLLVLSTFVLSGLQLRANPAVKEGAAAARSAVKVLRKGSSRPPVSPRRGSQGEAPRSSKLSDQQKAGPELKLESAKAKLPSTTQAPNTGSQGSGFAPDRKLILPPIGHESFTGATNLEEAQVEATAFEEAANKAFGRSSALYREAMEAYWTGVITQGNATPDTPAQCLSKLGPEAARRFVLIAKGPSDVLEGSQLTMATASPTDRDKAVLAFYRAVQEILNRSPAAAIESGRNLSEACTYHPQFGEGSVLARNQLARMGSL